MADDTETKELSPEDAEAAALAAKTKKKKLFIIIGAVVVFLLLAGGGTFFFLKGDKKTAGENAEGDKTEQAEGGEKAAEGEEPKLDEHGNPIATTVAYHTFKPPFVVNFFVEGKQRYLQISLTAMVRDPAVMDALIIHTPLIRNKIVMLVSGESLDELQTLAGKTQLQEKLLKSVQEIMQQEIKKPGVENILFDSFVIQ
jgi:flagellar FliL protein